MAETHDESIEKWKTKRLIKSLEAARGKGTSMISLILTRRDKIPLVTKMLNDEFGTASNIKSRVNRQSVLAAIASALQRLKLYKKVPHNGLILYTGTILTQDGKEKKVTFDFEPFKPINMSLYLCDNKFHTETLNEMIQSGDKFGFIVMDGNGALFGTLNGNSREVLYKFSVELQNSTRRGGQSANRIDRIRVEKRQSYVRKTTELAREYFIDEASNEPNVAKLILAGSADLKTKLGQSNIFDSRLQEIVLSFVKVSDGGEKGFNEAIDLSVEILADVKFTQEKKLLGRYYDEVNHDTGRFVSGLDDTFKALEIGAVKELIVWEDLDITGEVFIKHLSKQQEFDDDKVSLVEWFAENYGRFGCVLKFVTDKSQEGAQFCRGFGGIGGILRYPVDMRTFDEDSEDEDSA